MKKAFTLVEMLIVVAILATLMTITFRLSSISSGETGRTHTVVVLQKLENCLSGYYAAFGCYPPVAMHGTHDFYAKVNPTTGVQSSDGREENIWGWYDKAKHTVTDSNKSKEQDAWYQIEAACKAQPVGCEFPFADDEADRQQVKDLSEAIIDRIGNSKFTKYKADSGLGQRYSRGFDALERANRGGLNDRAVKWWSSDSGEQTIQLFKFGLMSYLLPRYLVMMTSDDAFYKDYAQWYDLNSLPRNPLTGEEFTGWTGGGESVFSCVQQIYEQRPDYRKRAMVENIASQAVCARWIANLQNICSVGKSIPRLYGIDVCSYGSSLFDLDTSETSEPPHLPVYFTGGKGYMLNSMTVKDYWGNEFYYYSPPPHQTYTLWSAGPNGRTFPPWVPKEKLSNDARDCVAYWTEDDIIRLAN